MTNVQGATSLAGMIYFMAICCYFIPGYIGVSVSFGVDLNHLKFFQCIGILIIQRYLFLQTVSPCIPLIVRENWKGLYHTSSYFISLMMMDVPFFILYPWVGHPFVWWLTSMQGPVSKLFRECFLLTILAELGVGVGNEQQKWSLVTQAFRHKHSLMFFFVHAGYFSATVAPNEKMGLIIITSLFTPTVMFASMLADTG